MQNSPRAKYIKLQFVLYVEAVLELSVILQYLHQQMYSIMYIVHLQNGGKT